MKQQAVAPMGNKFKNKISKSSKPEVYSEPCQASKMELFEKTVNGCQLFTIFKERSISDEWQCFECASASQVKTVVSGY